MAVNSHFQTGDQKIKSHTEHTHCQDTGGDCSDSRRRAGTVIHKIIVVGVKKSDSITHGSVTCQNRIGNITDFPGRCLTVFGRDIGQGSKIIIYDRLPGSRQMPSAGINPVSWRYF